MIEWISVKDRLPKDSNFGNLDRMIDEGLDFFLVLNDGEPEVAFFREGSWDSPTSGWLNEVTHWAEINLPGIPKNGDSK